MLPVGADDYDVVELHGTVEAIYKVQKMINILLLQATPSEEENRLHGCSNLLEIMQLLRFQDCLNVAATSRFLNDFLRINGNLLANNSVQAVSFITTKKVSSEGNTDMSLFVDDEGGLIKKVFEDGIFEALQKAAIIGAAKEHLCFYCKDRNAFLTFNGSQKTTGSRVKIIEGPPEAKTSTYNQVLGFGYCGDTSEHKMVIVLGKEGFYRSLDQDEEWNREVSPSYLMDQLGKNSSGDRFLYWVDLHCPSIIVHFNMVNNRFGHHPRQMENIPHTATLSVLRNRPCVCDFFPHYAQLSTLTGALEWVRLWTLPLNSHHMNPTVTLEAIMFSSDRQLICIRNSNQVVLYKIEESESDFPIIVYASKSPIAAVTYTGILPGDELIKKDLIQN